MLLVGITGAIGHGKTSFAASLQKAEPSTLTLESGTIITSIVERWLHGLDTAPPAPIDIAAINTWVAELPSIFKQQMHLDIHKTALTFTLEDTVQNPEQYQKLFEYLALFQTRPELSKQRITPLNKAQYRPILQWVGGYMLDKVSPTIWFDEIIRLAEQARLDNTRLCIASGLRNPSEADQIRRAGGMVIKVHRTLFAEQDLLDPTERQRSDITPDAMVHNNGTLAELDSMATILLQDLQTKNLRGQYP